MDAHGSDPTKATPFHGYYYRLLKAQGKGAPGGARSIVAVLRKA